MANEQEGPPPRGNDDRVQAWLKNQERDPEAQADSKALSVMPTRGADLPTYLDDGAAWGQQCMHAAHVIIVMSNACLLTQWMTAEGTFH